MDLKRQRLITPMLIVVTTVAVAILAVGVNQFTTYVDQITQTNIDRAVIKLHNEIDSLKNYANVASLLLAVDDEIKNALATNDRQKLISRVRYLNEMVKADVYIITDGNGVSILQSSAHEVYGEDFSIIPTINVALQGNHVVSFERGTGLNIQVVSGTAVYSINEELIGVVFVGYNLGTEEIMDRLKEVSGTEFMLFVDDMPAMSTALCRDGERIMIEPLPEVHEVLESGEPTQSRTEILGENIIGVFEPLATTHGRRTIGVMLVWESLEQSRAVVNRFAAIGAVVTVLALAVSSAFIFKKGKRIDRAIHEKEHQIGKHVDILSTINDISATFLWADSESVDTDLWQVMGKIGKVLDVDRVFLFKNYESEGAMYCTQLYEWVDGVKSELDNPVTIDVNYEEDVPGLLDMFKSNRSLNGIVETLPEEIRVVLEVQGVISVLLQPVFIRGELWGFTGVDDCKKKRVFTHDEEMAMRSVSSAFISTLIRKQQILKIRNHEEMEVQLTEANEAKSKFLAHMSHEIRTPLNAIIGFTDLSLELDAEDKVRQYLKNIQENSSILLSIINDILDISKVEADKMLLEYIPFSMSQFIGHVQSTLESGAKKKNLDFKVNVSEDVLEKKLKGDPTRLLQVMMNLISNAVKFTKEGEVSLTVECRSVQDNIVVIYFEVKDTGIGMTKEHAKNAVHPFMQADDSITRVFGGTGLGIPICVEILKLMNARLNIDSELNKGTTISFEVGFVLAREELADKLIDSDIRPIFDAEVLLCEDNEMNRQVMVEHLNQVGIRVVIAKNGKEGVDIVKNRVETGEGLFDLILMDVNMPIMGGLEATILINKMGLEIPVVAVTANVMTTDYERYRSAGMSKSLGKPFRPHELYECLLSFLRPIGYEGKKGNADLEEKFKERVKRLFVKENSNVIERLKSALDSEDMVKAHRIVHTIKSNAALIGEKDVQNIAMMLEKMYYKKEKDDGLLEQLEQNLEDTLTKLSKSLGSEEAQAKKLSKKELLEIIEAFEPMLATNNAKCLEMVEDILHIEELSQMAKEIEAFELKKAYNTMLEIKEGLQWEQ